MKNRVTDAPPLVEQLGSLGFVSMASPDYGRLADCLQQLHALPLEAKVRREGELLTSSVFWHELGCSELYAWGYCIGKGKNRYRSVIALDQLSYHCSCPSRKALCKHVYALYQLVERERGFCSRPPKWLAGVVKTKVQPYEQHRTRDTAPQDVAGVERRQQDRHAKVLSGLVKLDEWIRDSLRMGLWFVEKSSYRDMIRRLMDAQAPALGRLLREVLGDMDYASKARRLMRIHLISQAYQKLDKLSPALQEEVRQLVGYTTTREELLSREPVCDAWLLAKEDWGNKGPMSYVKYYFVGLNTGRIAIYVYFVHAKDEDSKASRPSYGEQEIYEAKAYFYPGCDNPRALMEDLRYIGREYSMQALERCAYRDLGEALEVFRARFAENPFLYNIKCLIAGVQIYQDPETNLYHLVDSNNDMIPISSDGDNHRWSWLSGGRPFVALISFSPSGGRILQAWECEEGILVLR